MKKDYKKTSQRFLATRIAEIEGEGCPVTQSIPEYVVLISYGDHLCFEHLAHQCSRKHMP